MVNKVKKVRSVNSTAGSAHISRYEHIYFTYISLYICSTQSACPAAVYHQQQSSSLYVWIHITFTFKIMPPSKNASYALVQLGRDMGISTAFAL